MKLLYTEKETKIIESIENRFKGRYSIDIMLSGTSIYINSKCTVHKLNIDAHLLDKDNVLIISIDDNEPYYMKLDVDETGYLDVLEDILKNLNNQLNIYKDFITDFQQCLENDSEYEGIMDIVKAQLYIKFHNNKVVIKPKFDMFNEDNYAAMYIDSIYGNYPMEKYTSISFDDLKSCIDFFLGR